MITDKDGYFIYVNHKFEDATEFKLKEIIGQTPRILKSNKHSKVFYNELWNTILSGNNWEGELLNKRKSGELYWSSCIISPIVNSKKEITHFVAVQQDITKEKNLLDELVLAKEKAEESDRLKSAFLANMSHEIRTPMNGILGFLELLKEPDLSEASKNKYIEIVNKSGQRLLNTINNIIEISKIDSKQITIQKSRFCINTLLNDLTAFFQPEALQKGLKMINHIPQNCIEIESDKSKLESVFTNLIKNAIKFTNKGFIRIDLKVTDHQLMVFIKDTGCGIPENKKESIFERFVQGDTNLSRPYEGSGLGLSITKEYINLLNGDIWFNSKKDIGTTFCVTFNLSDLKVSSSSKLQHTALTDVLSLENLDKKSILIAEDDFASFQYLSAILEDKQLDIIWAKNGLEAVEFALNKQIDLVLMDAKMPKLSGYQATIEILSKKPNLPIIMQTAFALSGDKEKALNCGCIDYITKPVSKHLLFDIINKHLK